MTYTYPEIRAFRGRYAQRNSFEVPDGALETALNVVVGNDHIISKRRGYYRYFLPGSGTLKALGNYEKTLMAIYEFKVSHFADSGTAPNQVGSETSNATETGVSVTITERIPRLMQQNKNLYFTTDKGVLKLTGYNSKVSKSGAPGAEDLTATFIPKSSAAWFDGDQIVGYRILFGRKDANDNLILGAPGDVASISNPTTAGVSYTSAGAGPWTVTVTSNGHGLVTGDNLTFISATDPDANGTYAITVLTANTFAYTVTSGNPASGTVSYYRAEAVLLEASVPADCADVTQGWFVQIYRSDQGGITSGFLTTYKLITQRDLTSSEISSRILYFTDTTNDFLRGAELYTNENTREGESQANFRAPKSQDIALFKNYSFYANCITRPYLNLALVNLTGTLANGDTVTIRVTDVTNFDEIYVARTGVGNQLAWSEAISGAGPFTVTYNAHGFNNGDTLYLSNIVGGTFSNQTATVSGATANTFTVTLTGTGVPTSLFFEGVTNGTNPIFTLSQSASAAIALQDTAQGFVKAINRNANSKIYGRYTSDFFGIPGQFTLFARDFPSQIAVAVSTSAAGNAFSPVLPTSFASGTQVTSNTTAQSHVLYISKVSEPEAVPLVNFIPIGSENAAILRIKTLRDSLIIIKEDGVFRLSGDNPNNFIATILDSTVICVGTDSVDVINNQVAMLANVGIVLISETAVNIISRKIEEDITPILGRSDSLSHGVAYESARLYLLTCTKPNDTSLSTVHVYNTLTDEWANWDTLFLGGVVGPEDTLYLLKTTNEIAIERKSQTRIDYCDQWYATTIVSVASNKKDIVATISAIPEAGDIIVAGNVINRIKTNPIVVGVNTYSFSFVTETTLIAGDTPILYKYIRSLIGTAPFHAGLVGRSKQFAQMQLHFRSDQCSRMTIYFTGDVYLGSDQIEWQAIWQRAGWGYFPWAFDYFGQGNGIDLPIGTAPSPICRIYVPIQQQRTSFIQTVLTHTEAGESINLQAQSWTVRPYAERVSR